MDIIKINQNAIKVALSYDECCNYDFITDSRSDDERMQESVNKLLEKIKLETGVDFSSKGLLIQVYCVRDGSCEIYIASTEEKGVYKERIASYGTRKNSGSYRSIFRFDSLDILISACYRLNFITDDACSQVYYEEDLGRYYLVCEGISSKELRFSFLNEYAKQIKQAMFYHISEHLKCLCTEKAIKIFSQLN
jgi:negative regulator of genetic competence, sporulation and motility